MITVWIFDGPDGVERAAIKRDGVGLLTVILPPAYSRAESLARLADRKKARADRAYFTDPEIYRLAISEAKLLCEASWALR